APLQSLNSSGMETPSEPPPPATESAPPPATESAPAPPPPPAVTAGPLDAASFAPPVQPRPGARRLRDKIERARRPRWPIALALVGFGGAFVCLVWLRAVGPPWVDFKDDQGIFTIQFPERPKVSTKPILTASGERVFARTASYGDGYSDEFYAVEACTYPTPFAPEKTELLFDNVGDEFVRTF